MISCVKCSFKVNNKMRFSIAKNFCPSCGSNLLSDLDFNEINAINKKLQSQDFIITLSNQLNKDLVQNLVYDLSIFFKFDLDKVYKREVSEITIASPSDETDLASIPNEDLETSDDQDEAEEKPKVNHKPIARAQSLSHLRDEVRREMVTSRESDDMDDDLDDMDDEESDEPVDERVARLKRVYETSPTLKKSFKGISRIG